MHLYHQEPYHTVTRHFITLFFVVTPPPPQLSNPALAVILLQMASTYRAMDIVQ